MLNKVEMEQLFQRLRKEDHDLRTAIDPGRDIAEDDEIERQAQIQLGRKIASDYASRDQLDIIAARYDLDPDLFARADIMDFFLLEQGWMLTASMRDLEEYEAAQNRSFDEMVRDEEYKLQNERHQQRFAELMAIHKNVRKVLEILGEERESRRQQMAKPAQTIQLTQPR